MAQLSVEVVRAEAERYRDRVTASSAIALNAEETALVGRAVARAAARRAIHEEVTKEWWPLAIPGGLLLAGALPWVIRLVTVHRNDEVTLGLPWLNHVINTHDTPAPPSASLWIGLGFFFFSAAGVMVLRAQHLHLRQPRGRSLRAGRMALLQALVLGLVTVSLFFFAYSGGVHGGQWPAARDALVRLAAKGAQAVLTVLAIGLLVLVWVSVCFTLTKWMVRPVLRPYDLLLLGLVDVCEVTHAHRGTWFQERSRRAVERALEKAARKAETALPARPFPGGRGPARADTLRLAAVVRQHRTPIARAGGPASFDVVTKSLWAGVLALIDDDWETLTAAAPPVTALSRLRRTAAAVWPPVVLLTAAVALPLIPAVAQAPDVAGGVRVTLIITAVLSLVLPRDSSAKASILDAVGKALSSRADK
ncbi:hypothetical protein [Streptomyces anandii]|uniref:hypothetical protein n=1 Tax=Streptomyces anandii TaxID=285454 RepID=UPI00167A4814|nr:hypothetical protein [Streptomyces anandii]GGX89891.1 hypothetical protein GCM10010510_38980 [Streptomyces anandii JCM 4720]